MAALTPRGVDCNKVYGIKEHIEKRQEEKGGVSERSVFFTKKLGGD